LIEASPVVIEGPEISQYGSPPHRVILALEISTIPTVLSKESTIL
jgi:hypothetical protein